jgi:hypothetical protein
MKLLELQAHLYRINRSINRAMIREGRGETKRVHLDDGSIGIYQINGVPKLAEIEDHVRHALIDLWSLKDYVKKTLRSRGDNDKLLWTTIKTDKIFALAADLANLAKHGELDRHVHGSFVPDFGKSSYNLIIERDPMSGKLVRAGINRITFTPGKIEIDVINQNNPECVSYHFPVNDHTGQQVDDACDVMLHAFNIWHQLLIDLKLPWPSEA